MSSPQRELLLDLFRNQPLLVLELLHRPTVKVPRHEIIRVEQTDPPTIAAPESPAGLVLSLHAARPALGIIVEAQLQQDTNKRYAWPHYVSGLRARLRCPVVLCVVTPKRSVARWAATPIRMGGGNVFQATVIGPAAIPAVTERTRAEQLPELAVLSSIAHGTSLDHERPAKIAEAGLYAIKQLELTRSALYREVILNSLSDSVRGLLQAMDPAKFEPKASL